MSDVPLAAGAGSTVPGASDRSDTPRKPRDDEIDVWGLTHSGKVRARNEDHFLLASLHKHLMIAATSLPAAEQLCPVDDRLSYLAMVADGVGGSSAGEEASRTALEAVTQYVTGSMACYYQADARSEEFLDLLRAAALRTHERVLERGEADPDRRGMATTLTLWMGVWPWVYLLQVGDSRYYLYRQGTLTQITRDQTMAEELVERGVLPRSTAAASPLAHVLSSSIGGPQSEPVVRRLPNAWDDTHVLCSDGLIKHVSDARIAERLAGMTSARQVCEALLQDALDGGGSDNITIIVGRAVPKDRG